MSSVDSSTITQNETDPKTRPSKHSSATPTKALYQHDESLRELVTSIIAIDGISSLSESEQALFKQATDKDMIVQTRETIFYAQGGGQPFDLGTMTSKRSNDVCSFEVTAVRTGSGGRVLHCGHFSSSVSFSVGDEITQVIDATRRELNSRIHTGGHIVGLSVRHLASCIPGVTELKAQHYPDSAFVEFKGTIDGKHKEAIQAKSNEFVNRALPVKVYWWKEAELRGKCAVVPDAVAIPQDDLIRAVDIEGAGAYPCGGTHVTSTNLVGQLQIRNISRRKGISKITYEIAI